MKNMKKKVLSMILAVIMVVLVLPMGIATVSANDDIIIVTSPSQTINVVAGQRIRLTFSNSFATNFSLATIFTWTVGLNSIARTDGIITSQTVTILGLRPGTTQIRCNYSIPPSSPTQQWTNRNQNIRITVTADPTGKWCPGTSYGSGQHPVSSIKCTNCGLCSTPNIPRTCTSARPCSFHRSGGNTTTTPTTPNYPGISSNLGNILGNATPSIGDALEIFKYLAGMSNVIDDGGKGSKAWNASLITGGSSPGIADALEIFKLLAGMDSLLG